MLQQWIGMGLVAASLACGAGEPEADAQPVQFSVCADVGGAPNGRVDDFTFTGTIEEAGIGLPPSLDASSCPIQLGVPLAALGGGSWVRLRDSAGNTSLLAVALRGFGLAGIREESVRVRLHSEWPDFSPVQNWIELRGADGALVFWLAEAGTVSELLGAEEVERGAGRVLATKSNQCIPSWSSYALDASVSGERASVETGQRTPLGGLVVWNGGVELQAENVYSSCDDAYVAHAVAAAWRDNRQLAEPEASASGSSPP